MTMASASSTNYDIYRTLNRLEVIVAEIALAQSDHEMKRHESRLKTQMSRLSDLKTVAETQSEGVAVARSEEFRQLAGSLPVDLNPGRPVDVSETFKLMGHAYAAELQGQLPEGFTPSARAALAALRVEETRRLVLTGVPESSSRDIVRLVFGPMRPSDAPTSPQFVTLGFVTSAAGWFRPIATAYRKLAAKIAIGATLSVSSPEIKHLKRALRKGKILQAASLVFAADSLFGDITSLISEVVAAMRMALPVEVATCQDVADTASAAFFDALVQSLGWA